MKAQEIVDKILEKSENNEAENFLTKEDFIKYHDEKFIDNAYKMILGRLPDSEGKSYYLDHLRSGRRSKMQIVTNIASSKEAKNKNIKIKNLFFYKTMFTLYKIPLLGYLIKWIQYIVLLPKYIQRFNSLENTTLNSLETLNKKTDEIYTNMIYQYEAFNQKTEKIDNKINKYQKINEIKFNETDKKFNLITHIINYFETIKKDIKTEPEKLQKINTDNFYVELENEFRGDPTEKLKKYLPYIQQNEKVIDIGCGKGEWLKLLKENGIEAVGVEINSLNANMLKKEGFEIYEEDALSFLKKQKDNSIDVITAFHVIEHLPFEYLLKFLFEIHKVLKPNGKLILETPNPKNVGVGACNFYTDPTHIKPLPPHLTKFLLKYSGFKNITLVTEEVGKIEVDNKDLQNFINEWVTQSEDYGFVGEKRDSRDSRQSG